MMKTILLNDYFHVLTWHSRLSAPLARLTAYMERKSIKTHLALTEAMMRIAETSHLTDVQQNKRALVIDMLHTYWVRELFPVNIENRGKRLPYIQDTDGTLCAMGYLLHETGREEYVDLLARTNNHVYLQEVSTGPLFGWLDENGVTKAEAMRIQPTYGWEGGYGWQEPSLFQQIMQVVPLAISFVYFVAAMYFAWVLIHALNLTRGKRVLGYVVFGVTNATGAFIVFALLENLKYMFW